MNSALFVAAPAHLTHAGGFSCWYLIPEIEIIPNKTLEHPRENVWKFLLDKKGKEGCNLCCVAIGDIRVLRSAKTHYLPQNKNSPMFACLSCIFVSPFYYFFSLPPGSLVFGVVFLGLVWFDFSNWLLCEYAESIHPFKHLDFCWKFENCYPGFINDNCLSE